MKPGDEFRVEAGGKVELRRIDPDFHGEDAKDAASPAIAKNLERMRQQQYLLYADRRYSLLVCLQGLDASGKDGTIAHVFSGMNPQGVSISAFKVPTPIELAHDFLWRVHRRTPEKGAIAIFNRSHYEDVLVVRVHGLVSKKVWKRRYERINEFEKNLVDAGTTILKFYLHISPEEQLRRFEQRLADPKRHWKISESDYTERHLWPEYMEAYEDVFRETSTKHAPWYVIPANHKWFRNLAVSDVIAGTLESMRLELPAPTVDIEAIRRKYHEEKKGERRSGKKRAR